MPKKSSDVEEWLTHETVRQKEAIKNASRHFDENDALIVEVLEGLYGQESSFGKKRRKRNIDGAAGDFHLEKKTAVEMGLKVTKDIDQRFDLEDSAAAAAKYLKTLDNDFRKKTIIDENTITIPISDSQERLKFTLAAYNAGAARIAKAQQKAKLAGKNPEKWDDVKEFLEKAGASPKKAKEIKDYVNKVREFSREFAKDKNQRPPTGEHWVTIDGRHILIRDHK